MAHESVILATTRRWLVAGVDFAVDTALGMTIRGRFDRFGGSYEVGADGVRIELRVDATSIDTGNEIWDGLLRSADGPALAEHPQVGFTSTHVRDVGGGRLRVEGHLEAAGKVEPVAFDAAVTEIDGGLRLEAAATIDRQRLGKSADGFAVFLPATVHLMLHLRASRGPGEAERSAFGLGLTLPSRPRC
jgi:polyisoprenoid-binding protein YceI